MLYSIINFFSAKADQLTATDKVNLLDYAGNVVRTDGTVLGLDGDHAMVEWPRFGLSTEARDNLCRIAG